MTVGATAPRLIRARCTVTPSVSAHAKSETFVSALARRVPALRQNDTDGDQAGTMSAASSSSGPTTVAPGPVTSSSTGSVRREVFEMSRARAL